MPIAKKWKLTHVDSSKTFGSVEDFFNQSTSAKVDEEIVAKHIEIDDDYGVIKSAELDIDNKSVIVVKEYKDQETYDGWKEEKDKLPTIDEGIKEEELELEPNWAYKMVPGNKDS